MKTWIKKHFALTDKGAGDIVKAIISSFLLCVANFLPAMLLLLFLDELVLQNLKNHSLYIIFSIIVLIIIYILLIILYFVSPFHSNPYLNIIDTITNYHP